jgi:hypothetical protein
LVLLVLAAVWAAVLIPPALRARQEGRPSDSISNFRRQLAVLRRTGPRTSRGSSGDHWNRPYAPPPPTLATVSRLPTAQNLAGRGRPYPGPVGRGSAGHLHAAPSRPRTTSAARSRTLRRRRDVLTGLAAAVVITLLLAVATGLSSTFVMLHLLADVLLVAYVALLIHQRNAAAERDMNVRFLPDTGRFDPSLMPGEPALLRRSAN